MEDLPVIFTILGGLLLVGAAFLTRRNLDFLRIAIRTQGQVVGVDVRDETSTDSDGVTTTTTMHYPVVGFDTSGGPVTEASRNGTSWERFQVGQTVDLMYRPDKPADFEFGTGPSFMFWLPTGILIFLGAIFMSIGGFLLMQVH